MVPNWYCSTLGVGGWILMITFWAGVIAAAVWAVSRLFPASAPRRRHDPPEVPAGGETPHDHLAAGLPTAHPDHDQPAGRA